VVVVVVDVVVVSVFDSVVVFVSFDEEYTET
jgi:hypothetical protein